MYHDDDSGLYAELGLDPAEPELAAAMEDEALYQTLVMTLTDLRNRRGVNQEAVAEIMRTKQSAISRLESGLSDARYSTLQRYARAIGARLDSTVHTDDDRAYPVRLRLLLEHEPETVWPSLLRLAVERG